MNDLNMIQVPLRQSAPINLGQELTAAIKRDYFQPPSAFEPDLATIGRLRDKITNLKQENVQQQSKDVLEEYLNNLVTIRKKFADDCVEFQWYTTIAYGIQGPTKLKSLLIEQLNILFQTGAVCSHLARSLKYSDDDLKKACNLYLVAGGYFEQILILGQDKPMIPLDLHGNTISFLKALMLAQAQETVWLKALNNLKVNDSLIAKLSIQVSEYYEQAFQFGKASDHIKLEWINHVGVKKFHFKAAANYRMSLVKLHTFKYGEQVGYLRLASNYCSSAMKFKKYVGTLVMDDLQGLTDIVKTNLSLAERDNDLIYLHMVPKDQDLTISISSLTINLIKPDVNETKIFKDLLPYNLIQVAQAYRERQDNHIQQSFVAPLQASTKNSIKYLTDRNLPASIDAIQQTENLPDSIIQHSQEIVGRGGIQYIEESLKEINQLSDKCVQLVHQCYGLINLDNEEEDMLLQRGSHRSETQVAASELIERIQKMNDYLTQAKSGDLLIVEKYNNTRPILEIYCDGYKSLNEFIPDSKFVKLDKDLSILIGNLRNAIEKLQLLETLREQALQSIEIKSREENILPKIIEEYRQNHVKIYQNGIFDESYFEPVYESHMLMFNSDLSFVSKLTSEQMKLEQEIDKLNQLFQSNYKNNNLSKREKRLQTLEELYSLYVELISNLSEGSTFYSDFLSKGTSVLKSCENYLHSRRVEGRQIEAELNYNSINGDSTNSVSPKAQLWDPNHGIKFQ